MVELVAREQLIDTFAEIEFKRRPERAPSRHPRVSPPRCKRRGTPLNFIPAKLFVNRFWGNEIYYKNALLLLV